MSPEYKGCHVNEFVGRHNTRAMDSIGQLELMVEKLVCKWLMYREFIPPNGLSFRAQDQ